MCLLMSVLLLTGVQILAVTGSEPPPLSYQTFADAGTYLFNPSPQIWSEAASICRLYGDHLAFPKTESEAQALWSIMETYGVQKIHLGFHDQFIEGDYYSVKGQLISEMNFTQWAPGYPNGGNAFNCGGLWGSGLADQVCDSKLPSICEKEKPVVIPGFKDYDLIPGHGYYKYFVGRSRWAEALLRCYNDGSHMWIINSEEEYELVFDKYNVDSFYDLFHVGLHQYHEMGYFVTIFDQPIEETGYTKWVREPDLSSDGPKIVVVRQGGLQAYYDDLTDLVICEHSLDV